MTIKNHLSISKECILIADNSQFHREMLVEILGDKYEYDFAENGLQVLEMLSSGEPVDILILDIDMSQSDGLHVIKVMNERHWIEEVPVIVISADDNSAFIKQAYELGATDYISRPFNAVTVQHRVENTLALYSKQKRLVQLVEEQVYERENINNMMINIFSHVIESRNFESGSHTLNVQSITNQLLHCLTKKTNEYSLSEADISLISSISALHDIGKLTIPEDILNKPGKLSEDEWEIMKAHTTNGDELLKNTSIPQNEKFMIIAREIARWHHERWDGNGYPDGLSGNSIPISAQVVSIADVYDALTSDRCYKSAFSHDEAISMIYSGKCGIFNPLLIDCLAEISDSLKVYKAGKRNNYNFHNEAIQLTDEMLSSNALPLDDSVRRMIRNERIKKNFFASQCGDIQFEYDRILQKVTYINHNESIDTKKIIYLNQNEDIQLLNQKDWNELVNRLNNSTREHNTVEMTVLIPVKNSYRWHKVTAITVWPARGTNYIFVVGQFKDIHDSVTIDGIGSITMDKDFTVQSYNIIKRLFEIARIVDPNSSRVLKISKDGSIAETESRCYNIWCRKECCKVCTSSKAMNTDKWVSKLEVGSQGIYSVLSKRIQLGNRACVLEIALLMSEKTESSLKSLTLPNKSELLLTDLYKDSLTRAYSRSYLDDFTDNLQQLDGVAIVDIDRFKIINDIYGHQFGDKALRIVSKAISACIKNNGILIRYGGDEFLILFKKIERHEFFPLLKEIKNEVSKISFYDMPDFKINISIGGAYRTYPLTKAISTADNEMYKDKQNSSAKNKNIK